MKLTITQHGYEILQRKIEQKHRESQELLEEIRIARESSSSTEDNPDVSILTNQYECVLNEKSELQEWQSKANIVDVTTLKTDKVTFGVLVKIQDVDTDEVFEYRIVSPIESDISAGMISYESPMGRAMIGCTVGDVFDFDVRGNTKEFEVLSISNKGF
jgi:transcription elongation factor GreA